METNLVAQFQYLPNEAGARVTTVAAVMGCSVPTVWRLAKAGKIKAIRLTNRMTVFNVGSVREFLNPQK
jgi:excisionase family DNA binding protein